MKNKAVMKMAKMAGSNRTAMKLKAEDAAMKMKKQSAMKMAKKDSAMNMGHSPKKMKKGSAMDMGHSPKKLVSKVKQKAKKVKKTISDTLRKGDEMVHNLGAKYNASKVGQFMKKMDEKVKNLGR